MVSCEIDLMIDVCLSVFACFMVKSLLKLKRGKYFLCKSYIFDWSISLSIGIYIFV
jgi:hypothetical protein